MPADSSCQEPLHGGEEGPLLAESAERSRDSGSLRRAGAAVALSCAALAATAAVRGRASATGRSHHFRGEGLVALGESNKSEEKNAAACAWKGGECTDSHCCLDGGDHGFQCYQRDESLAVCDESCEEGEREEDDIAGYDASGNPFKLAWSCKKLGNKSQPGCQVFNKKKCPKDRCEWKTETCKAPCANFGKEDCGSQDACEWAGKKCADACWAIGDNKTCATDNKDRCLWKGEKCHAGCWTYHNEDACWQGEQCVWRHQGENGSCEKDTCSSPGEDCSKTRCCSAERSGGGMTCFQKDKNFASCSKTCDKEDGWNCKKLGNRTKTQSHCSWAGKDCSTTGMCCNTGFECRVKDDTFTGCVQTFKMMVLDGKLQKIHLELEDQGFPADSKFIGGGQMEYEMPKANEGEELGTSLYCVMAYLPDSYEQRLMELAEANYASVFACDGHDIFKTWQTGSVTWGSKETTLQNTDVFVDVWNQVKKAGNLWGYDWTVKVDPDCLIVPQRLKWHLEALKPQKGAPIYVKNNNLNASQGNNGFLGAVEVFTREALELYYDWWPQCEETLGVDSGEDGFMKGCMDAMGVGYIVDGGMFKPDDNVELCKDGVWAAYHPLKDQKEYQCCIDIAYFGEQRKTAYGKCKDMPDNWANKTWPGAGADGVEPRWRAR